MRKSEYVYMLNLVCMYVCMYERGEHQHCYWPRFNHTGSQSMNLMTQHSIHQSCESCESWFN